MITKKHPVFFWCFPSKIVVLLTLNSSEGATKLWLFFTSAAAPLSYWAISNYQNKTLRGKDNLSCLYEQCQNRPFVKWTQLLKLAKKSGFVYCWYIVLDKGTIAITQNVWKLVLFRAVDRCCSTLKYLGVVTFVVQN